MTVSEPAEECSNIVSGPKQEGEIEEADFSSTHSSPHSSGGRERLSNQPLSKQDTAPNTSLSSGTRGQAGESSSTSITQASHNQKKSESKSEMTRNLTSLCAADGSVDSTPDDIVEHTSQVLRAETKKQNSNEDKQSLEAQLKAQRQLFNEHQLDGTEFFGSTSIAQAVSQAAETHSTIAIASSPSQSDSLVLVPNGRTRTTDRIKECQRYFNEQIRPTLPPPTYKRKRSTVRPDSAIPTDSGEGGDEADQPARKTRRRAKLHLKDSACPKGEELARRLKRGPFFVQGQLSGGAKQLALEYGLESWQSNSIDVACGNWLKKNFTPEECAMFRVRETAVKKKNKPKDAKTSTSSQMKKSKEVIYGRTDTAGQYYPEARLPLVDTSAHSTDHLEQHQPQQHRDGSERTESDYSPAVCDALYDESGMVMSSSSMFDSTNTHHQLAQYTAVDHEDPLEYANESAANQSLAGSTIKLEDTWGVSELPHEFTPPLKDALYDSHYWCLSSPNKTNPLQSEDGHPLFAEEKSQDKTPISSEKSATAQYEDKLLSALSDEEFLGLPTGALHNWHNSV